MNKIYKKKIHFGGNLRKAYVESRGTKVSWRPHHTGDICITRKTMDNKFFRCENINITIREYVLVVANWKHIYILISMWKKIHRADVDLGIEDPYHFLFTCPLYPQIRVVMLDSISNVAPDIAPGLSLLLRGDINLTFDKNKAIFEYVQAFIRTISRF